MLVAELGVQGMEDASNHSYTARAQHAVLLENSLGIRWELSSSCSVKGAMV
jgi:hypothetical protein